MQNLSAVPAAAESFVHAGDYHRAVALEFGHFPRATRLYRAMGLKQSRRNSPLLNFRESSWRSTWQAGSPPYWMGGLCVPVTRASGLPVLGVQLRVC